jgi:branched-subunit amino acid ABC-type transport system permease component
LAIWGSFCFVSVFMVLVRPGVSSKNFYGSAALAVTGMISVLLDFFVIQRLYFNNSLRAITGMVLGIGLSVFLYQCIGVVLGVKQRPEGGRKLE